MQSILETLRTATGEQLGLTVGFILVGAVTVQAAVLFFSSLRRAYFEGQQRRVARELLQLQVKTAAAQLRVAEENKLHWNGYRKFTVARKVRECDDVFSFYLQPHDNKSLPPYKPGQYLTFQCEIPDHDKPVIRCYSLSDCARPDCYRVTIKKLVQPDGKLGVVSSYFCDTIKEGDILDLKAAAGNFFLDLEKPRPVVLISGGVGITPMLSIANAIAESGDRREVWFVHGARNRVEHIQKEHLEKLAVAHPNIQLHVCYSRPTPADQCGRDYQHEGHVTAALLKQILPSNNYEYFICGPGPMMKDMTDGLKAWDVPDGNIHFEAFGPATVKKAAPQPSPAETQGPGWEITFGRSGKKARWSSRFASLLELADEQGVKIENGCRAGNCGTCLVALRSGQVEYLADHGALPEEGSCLTCICKPKTNLVLDA